MVSISCLRQLSQAFMSVSPEFVHVRFTCVRAPTTTTTTTTDIELLSTKKSKAESHWLITVARASSHLLRFFSKPGNRPQKTLLGGQASFLLGSLLLLLFSDPHLCGKFTVGGFQGASVIRGSHSSSSLSAVLI